MSARVRTIMLVSMHTSPEDSPGTGDAGGMNVVERAQAEALARRGHEVVILTRRSHADSPSVVELASGVTVRHLDAGPPEPLPKSRIDDHLEEFTEAMRACVPPDVIHTHHWMSGVAALPVAREWGVPLAASYHSIAALPGSPLSEGEPPESARRVAGERLIADRADLILAVSQAEADTVVHRCGGDPARIEVIRPAVDSDLFRPLHPGETRWHGDGIPADRPYVMFAARLQPLKAPDLAVAAHALVDPAIRPTLVLAGEVSADFADYTDALHAAVADAGTADEVVFVGGRTREQFARLLRGAAMMLVPSFSETFGLVALEANASGIPVLAADSGGLREAIVDGRTGYVLDSRDPRVWAATITALLTRPELAHRLGQHGRARAVGLTWDAVAGDLLAAYQRLVEAGPR